MKKFFGILCILFATLSASDVSDSTRTLRISSWPIGAEIYPEKRPESFVRKSDAKTPHEIALGMSDTIIRVTLFKPGYADTTLDIRAPFPRNFAWIALSEESDLEKIEWQEKILAKRENRRTGKILFASSLVPLSLAGTFAVLSEFNFRDASDSKKKIERSVIREGKNFHELQKDFSDSRRRGKNYRTAAAVSLGIGSLLLASAIIFHF